MITGSIIHKAWLEANNVTVSPWDTLSPHTQAIYEAYATALQGMTYVNGRDLWVAFGNDPSKAPPASVQAIYRDAAKRINAAIATPSVYTACPTTGAVQPVVATPGKAFPATPRELFEEWQDHIAARTIYGRTSWDLATDSQRAVWNAFHADLVQRLQSSGLSPVATETEQPKEIDWLAINAACSGKPRYRKP